MESYGVYPSQKLHKLTPVLLPDRDGQVPASATGDCPAEHPRVRILRVRPGASGGAFLPCV